MESYIEEKKKLYSAILEFLEKTDDKSDNQLDDDSFQLLTNLVKSQQIEGNQEEMEQFLEIIKSIGDNHHHDRNFNQNMKEILLHYKEQIKQTLSNEKIFHIFENNKQIILFLLKNDIITISEPICNEMINKVELNGNRYWHFFIPELEKMIDVETIKIVKDELSKKDSNFFEKYEEKREEGENDSNICSLIRKDSIEEFIIYINRNNISLSSTILPSIFETNSFLIENKNTTLIEYSAFYGSIQIFQYLILNQVDLTSSLWNYSIHSKNAELIHILESNIVLPQDVQCFIESIKCHHNDIANYIYDNVLIKNEEDSKQKEEIISNCIKYHNFSYFEIKSIFDYGFFYLNLYHYDKLFELLFKDKEKIIEKKEIISLTRNQ